MKELIISGELENVIDKQRNITLSIMILLHLLVPSFLLLFNFFNTNITLFIIIIIVSLYNCMCVSYVFFIKHREWMIFTNIPIMIFMGMYILYYYLYLTKRYTTSSDPEIIKKYERRRKIKSIL